MRIHGLVMGLVGVVASQAQARPPTTSSSAPSGAGYVAPPEPEPTSVEPGYRAQLLFTDLASIAVVATGATSSGGLVIGLAGYTFGGPLIHEIHDNPGRAAASLGIRVGAPLLGALAFGGVASASHGCRQDDFDCDSGVGPASVAGAVLGGVIAIIIDDAFLARPRKVYAAGPTVSVTANVDHDRTSVGLAGRF